MKSRYIVIGVCGLSCRLCPMHHTDAESRCAGCKSKVRMAVGCPFITCAVKKKGIEFCWDCEEGETCKRWKQHREIGKQHDSFKSYQTLEDDIIFIQKNGVHEFENLQKIRELEGNATLPTGCRRCPEGAPCGPPPGSCRRRAARCRPDGSSVRR